MYGLLCCIADLTLVWTNGLCTNGHSALRWVWAIRLPRSPAVRINTYIRNRSNFSSTGETAPWLCAGTPLVGRYAWIFTTHTALVTCAVKLRFGRIRCFSRGYYPERLSMQENIIAFSRVTWPTFFRAIDVLYVQHNYITLLKRFLVSFCLSVWQILHTNIFEVFVYWKAQGAVHVITLVYSLDVKVHVR